MKIGTLKMTLFFMLLIVLASSCRSSRNGCPSTKYSGERYKATKFSWE